MCSATAISNNLISLLIKILSRSLESLAGNTSAITQTTLKVPIIEALGRQGGK